MVMDYTRYSNTASVGTTYDVGLRKFMLQIYNYMAGALALTGFTSFLVASSPALMAAIFGSSLVWVVMFAPVIMVFVLSANIGKMSTQTSQIMLAVYAVLMGLSLSSIFMMYTGTSIARTFFVTASIFGAMSIYGHTTKRDLTNVGSFLFMGLIGIILASLVNIFLKSTGLSFAVSVLGVLIFVGLTAYDTQKLKGMYNYYGGNVEIASKMAVMGALTLYLDFINLFMMLLQFFGQRRSN
jgi:FtsH-binding integral membrane protein